MILYMMDGPFAIRIDLFQAIDGNGTVQIDFDNANTPTRIQPNNFSKFT